MDSDKTPGELSVSLIPPLSFLPRSAAVRALRRALASALAVGVATAVVEGTLRLSGFSYPTLFVADRVLGVAHRENVEGWFTTEGHAYVRFKRDGLRDKTFEHKKPPGIFRVAVLGDSFMEALQVENAKTFSSILEESLSVCFEQQHLEVMNFGVSDFGTAQALLMLRHRVWAYDPDMVLLAVFTGNDIRNNSISLEWQKARPFFTLENGSLVLDQSFAAELNPGGIGRRTRLYLEDNFRLVQLLRSTWHRYLATVADVERVGDAGVDSEVYRPPASPDWKNAWAVTEALIGQIQMEVRARQKRFLLVTLTNGVQVDPDPAVREAFVKKLGIADIFYPDRRLESYGRSREIDVITLAPEMQKLAEQQATYFHGFANTLPGRGHWNEAGHATAAALVSSHICKRVDSVTERLGQRGQWP